MSTKFDIVVVGGGPAGSTAAGYLAMHGHSVLLLERSEFPRHRIGESLLPSLMPILEDFGLVSSSLVLVEVDNGEVVRHQVLQDVWTLIRDKPRFIEYVQGSVAEFLE